MRDLFVCEVCGNEVVNDNAADAVKGREDIVQRFNHAVRFVTDGLKKSEDMVVPA